MTINRIWHAFGLQPHRSEAFKLSSDPQLIEKVRDIVGLYMDPPDHTVAFCVDEKGQIEALDHTQPLLPLRVRCRKSRSRSRSHRHPSTQQRTALHHRIPVSFHPHEFRAHTWRGDADSAIQPLPLPMSVATAILGSFPKIQKRRGRAENPPASVISVIEFAAAAGTLPALDWR